MKREKLFSALWGVVLSFCLSFSVAGGMVTAFSMDVSLATLALVCLGASVLSGICYSLPLGLVMPGVLAFGLGYAWHSGDLELSVEALLYRLSRQYHMGYNWPIIRWTGRVAEQMEASLPLGLCFIGVAVAVLICRSVCRGKRALPGVALSLLCMAACFVVNDTVPGPLYLLLFFLSLITLLMTAGVRRRDMGQGNRLTAMALPATALCLSLLFTAVPKQAYSTDMADKLEMWLRKMPVVQTLLGMDENHPGDTSTVDLAQVGYRIVGNNKVLDVKADFSQYLYLRGQALDYYDGVSWSLSDNTEITQLNWPEELPSAGVVELSSKYAHRMLYVPYYPASRSMRESYKGVKNGQKLTQYSFSTLQMPSQEDLKKFQVDSQNLSYYMSKAITLPDSVKKWAQPMVQKLTQNPGNVYETAQLIAAFVRASASYDTETPRMGMGKKDFARWFLQDSDTGYCIHFATATTVLLQASGIPARYVSGYAVQTVAGQTVEVTADMAHAWCEYWLPGFGWTVLESTPPDLRPQDSQQTEERPEARPQAQKPEKPEKTPKALEGFDWLLPVALALTVLGLWGQYALRIALRKRELSRGDRNAQALARWQYSQRLAKRGTEPCNEVLYGLAQKARFSQHTLTDEELSLFDGYLAGAVAALKKRNVFMQIYYRLVLALY